MSCFTFVFAGSLSFPLLSFFLVAPRGTTSFFPLVFILFIYIYVFILAAPGLSCGMKDLPCSMRAS